MISEIICRDFGFFWLSFGRMRLYSFLGPMLTVAGRGLSASRVIREYLPGKLTRCNSRIRAIMAFCLTLCLVSGVAQARWNGVRAERVERDPSETPQ